MKLARPNAQHRSAQRDTARLDWLERKTVNVRDPLLYGSRNVFWANPGDERNGEKEGAPSDLRKQIDEAMKAEAASVGR